MDASWGVMAVADWEDDSMAEAARDDDVVATTCFPKLRRD